ncbi:hypothetical protein [Bacillus piscicola]|uniref:hypothetical protein n=1 Tax=Bacillus piscicola TaxID=1632684 RepID=UPI001F08DB2E|nr:hypothetical protein [Bacillus piscicola]
MNILTRIASYCPYTIAGRKVLRKAKGDQPAEKKSKPADDDEKRLIQRIKTGRNISLIGIFCPLFWSALIMGSSDSVLLFNAVHSGLFIVFGAIYALSSSQALRKHRLKKPNEKGYTMEYQK